MYIESRSTWRISLHSFISSTRSREHIKHFLWVLHTLGGVSHGCVSVMRQPPPLSPPLMRSASRRKGSSSSSGVCVSLPEDVLETVESSSPRMGSVLSSEVCSAVVCDAVEVIVSGDVAAETIHRFSSAVVSSDLRARSAASRASCSALCAISSAVHSERGWFGWL